MMALLLFKSISHRIQERQRELRMFLRRKLYKKAMFSGDKRGGTWIMGQKRK